MEERPPPAELHPPAVVWLQVRGLVDLGRRPLPPVVRRPAAAGWRAIWAHNAPPAETPAAGLEESPAPPVLHPPAAILFLVVGLGELGRWPLPRAVRRPAAAERQAMWAHTAPPAESPYAELDLWPPAEALHPPAVDCLQVWGLVELGRRRPPAAVRQPAAAARRAEWARTAPPAETPAAAMEERPPPAVLHPPAVVWLQVGGLVDLGRRPLPPAVRAPAASGRRAMWAHTAPPAETPAAALEMWPPPAVLHPLAVVWLQVGGLVQ